MRGLPRALMFMSSASLGVKKGITDGMIEAGNLLKEEVKASVAGQRAEPRSVDTGEFLSSVELGTTKTSATVFSDVPQSLFMEFGTSRGIRERRHFRNSLARNKKKIIGILDTEIKQTI